MLSRRTKDLVLCAVFVALIIVGAFIRIPVPVVPFTLQFLFTMLAGLLLGPWLGTAAVCVYILMGLLGLPVFAEGGGFAYVLKPSFGYIIGFAAGAFVTGSIANKTAAPGYGRLFAANFAGLGIVYFFGMAYYYLISNFYLDSPIGIGALFLYCFVLAVPGDVALCVVGALIGKRLIPLFSQKERRTAEKMTVKSLTEKVLRGAYVTKEEALFLYGSPLEELCAGADSIRRHFCGNAFDLCTIVNGKSGRCSENCKFCAQSAHNHTGAAEYPLLDSDAIVAQAKAARDAGALRFSVVTSGKRLSDEEADAMCETARRIRAEVGISVCVSFGLLSEAQFRKLKEAGVSRVHNNLETSRRFFPEVCTTHSYEDKIHAIRAAQAAGLSVCSGGIMGLGETAEDRVDMAFALRELGISSVPLNMLNPIPGTPFENNRKLTEEDMRRVAAVYRYVLPRASVRLAGGRGLLADKGKSCFASGANAAITGDMLTTAGITIQTDLELLRGLGYKAELCDE